MDERGHTDLSVVTIVIVASVGILLVEQIECASPTVACFGWLYKLVPIYLGIVATLLGSFFAGLAGKLMAHRIAAIDGP